MLARGSLTSESRVWKVFVQIAYRDICCLQCCLPTVGRTIWSLCKERHIQLPDKKSHSIASSPADVQTMIFGPDLSSIGGVPVAASTLRRSSLGFSCNMFRI